VVPHLADLIERARPRTICDVGCGTGYIARRLAQRATHIANSWLLVDIDPEALQFAAKSTLRSGKFRTRQVDLTAERAFTCADRVDFALVVFTLLEFEFAMTVAHNLGSLLRVVSRDPVPFTSG
jgi:methylase of polypeptide subunit release factors